MRWWVAVVRRPSTGTVISSARSISSLIESSSSELPAMRLPDSMLAVDGSGAARLSSWVTDGSISSDGFLANRFFREKLADMMVPQWSGLSADAQEVRLLRQRLQVDFL